LGERIDIVHRVWEGSVSEGEALLSHLGDGLRAGP
jgi:hypothetical protein